MSPHPAITVLMPVYNREAYVGEAMESILGQSFGDFEFLIINDGSSDRGREVVLAYQDSRIRFLEHPENLGLIATLNHGLEQAQGAYVAIMDSDDVSLPRRLEKQYALLEANPRLAACGAGTEFFSERPLEKRWLVRNDPERLRIDLFFNSPMAHGTLMLRKSLQRRHAIRYDPGCPHAEDYDFISRLAKAGDVAAVEEILYRYRRHANQTTVTRRVEQEQTSQRIRARLLKELGLECTARELEVHNLLAVHRFAQLGGRVDEVEQWLAKLHRALTEGGGHNPDKVRAALWNYWLLLCLSLPPRRGLAGLTRIFRSPLSGVFPWQNMSPYKMLLYYSYRKLVCT